MANIEKRIARNGETTFRVKVRLKGVPVQSATFDKLKGAKDWAQQTETAIREGRYFKMKEAEKHTLTETIDRYVKNVIPTKPKAEPNRLIQLAWWKAQLGTYVLADITPAIIAQHRDKLLTGDSGKRRSHATVNRYLAALSHVFTIATNEWGWLDSSPVRKVTKMKEPRGRVRFLSDEERGRLLVACRTSSYSHLYLVVVVALSTGARRMEVLGLRYQDMDVTRCVITLHDTKNGERRILPLTGHALELMQDHIEKIRLLNCDLVFPGHKNKKPMDIRTPFDNALKQAGITDFRFHDLRHSAASYLAMSGASLAEIAEVLGHKTLSMVKRYSHLSEAHTSKVVAKMNNAIFENHAGEKFL
jgi:integrase